MSIKEILKKIDGSKQFVIDMQKGLTAIPALSPTLPGGEGEYDKAVYLESVLKKMKFDEVYRLDCPDKKAKNGVRPNIIAKYYGKDKTKNFWVMAHMDIVSPGDLSLWKTDPYKAEVKGDLIYGRGTEDNQQGLISGLVAVKAMMDLGIRPDINFSFIFNADEETGSAYGIGHIVKKHFKIFGKNDCVMVPDGGNKEGTQVEVAEKSICWLKFKVFGKQFHASMPESGNNAHRAGANLIVALDEALHKKFNKKDKMFAPSVSTFEPTKKESNVDSINILPGEDVFYFDCRILPVYKVEQVMKEVNAVVKKISQKFKTKITVEVVQNESSIPTNPKAEIVKATVNAVKLVYKNNPKVVGIGGGTVSAFLRNKGVPCVVYSKLLETLHSPNECSSIKNTLGDAKVFAHMAMTLK
ncbi:Succinyl-diaminopimelate desuccinylase [Elusimicrobium minutum Pei191]|uniref:Succinyl-diaminopimelate desuccinylase n=1 Tax=Elusimicrobium minutum (strain Pei191) TaxID=445932 RepID=B2KB37_ELUMP|nr:M20 family metallo-hydrolase [Elusimicrobium minutum]ACC97796.1 Succinyl-diaminopimelate desuccinylase [Elusimicrobium minutum Pei191]